MPSHEPVAATANLNAVPPVEIVQFLATDAAALSILDAMTDDDVEILRLRLTAALRQDWFSEPNMDRARMIHEAASFLQEQQWF
jgi:hypothetical protein